VWRDTASLWPGEDWRARIRDAITRDALVFIACFSSHSVARRRSYQNEELRLAIDQLRLRRPDDPWLIPVRFDDCDVPDFELGAGRTLASIQQANLFGASRDLAARRLVEAVQRLLWQPTSPPPGGRTAESPLGTASALPHDAHDSRATGTRTRSRASVRCVATITGHRQSRGLNGMRRGIIAVAFNPDGYTLATGSGDNTVILWDIADPGNPTNTAVLSVHDVRATAFSPDGRTLATGTNKTAMLWDTSDRADPMLISTLPDHQGDLSFGSVKFSIDGSILTTSAAGSVFLWDVRERVRSGRIQRLKGRGPGVTAVPVPGRVRSGRGIPG